MKATASPAPGRPFVSAARACSTLHATRGHIAAQFITESVILGTTGGAAGLLLGALVTAAVAHARHWGLLIPPLAPVAGLAVAVLIGGVAGLYPAVRAARLAPAEALRAV